MNSMRQLGFVCLAAAFAVANPFGQSSEARGAAKQPPPPPAPDGYTFVRTLAGVSEYRLNANDLTVLLVPGHSAPVVTFQVTYRVGSRNEVTGTTGSTHLLEHLMFKGSEHYNDPAGNSVKQYLERVGGIYNATTSVDRTNYYATTGKDALPGYIAVESDRMRNLWLHESDRQSEMTVVRNEFERGKNDPQSVLEEEVTAAAYEALPYHHSTIGWRSDIENVPIEKLRAFYDTYYWPNNATVTVVGDFEPAAALAVVNQNYGKLGRSPVPIPDVYTTEPEQTGARRVIVKRPGEIGSVLIAHKVPNGRDADQAALQVLDGILSGGKSSRLYRSLVDTGIVLEANASTGTNRDLSLHEITLALPPETSHAKAEKAALDEVERIKSGGVTPEEVRRVIAQLLAAEAYQRDGSASVAAQLNEWIAVGDWALYITFPERVAKVTAADVLRVAKLYLNEDQSTTGWFVPVQP